MRLELPATFYKHPLEILVNGLLSNAILALLVGATPGQTNGSLRSALFPS